MDPQEVIEDSESQTDTEPVSSAVEAPDLAAEIEKWKSLSRKHEARAKDNADKAKRLDEIEEQSKSDLQKAIERAEKAEAQSAEAELKAIRAEVAASKGVPADMLRGETLEALTESADRLLEFRGTSATPPAPSSEGQGKRGEPIGGKSDQITSIDALKNMKPEEINEARRSGRLDLILKA
ncbi:MAG: hypothetical protein ACKOAF_05430 [Actinomycetes bacterium]